MDLKDCLKKMQDAGRLAHVTTPVDAVHELGGVCEAGRRQSIGV